MATMKRARAATAPSALLPEPVHPTGTWAADEHDRFLEAMRLFPKGPWKAIADHVATRSVRQVQTHAQKYQEKVVRRMRGLRKPKRKGDESDEDIGHRVVMGTYGKLRKRRKGDTSDPEIDPTAAPRSASASRSPSPVGSPARTDHESGGESDSSDDSDADRAARQPHDFKICVSTASSTLSTRARATKSTLTAKPSSFSALLEDQSPVSPDCIDLAPSRLSELSPGWLYLDDLNLTDKVEDLVEETESALDGPSALPSLGESLDFFIEYLSIVIS